MYWEVQILQGLENIRNPLLTELMEGITFLSESVFLVVLIATIYWCIDKQKAARMSWIVLGSGVVNGVLKNTFRTPRPFKQGVVVPLRIETATSYSFPSGHTQSATAFWTIFYKMFKVPLIKWVAIIMIGLTAFTRLYLGVHWPVDVIAGIIVGLISVALLDLIYDERKGFNKWHILGMTSVVLVFIVLPVEEDLCKTIGALWGMVVGGYYEQQAIQFSTKGRWKEQLIKIIIGGLGLIGIYTLLGYILPEYNILEMIRYAIVLLWITAGAPLLFKQFIRRDTPK